MMKKIRGGVNAMSMRMRCLRLGCRGVKIMAGAIQERQGSVLTNRCLGKETNGERGAEKSFLTAAYMERD
jgi:hypothetical protein